jgi:hypothetical protein
MPIFRNRTVFEIYRDIRAFLNLDLGVIRGQSPYLQQLESGAEQLQQAQRLLAEKDHKIGELQAELNVRHSGARVKNLNPQNIIWIFGSIRSGSTWLRSMMGDLGRYRVWEEPGVGRLFGEFYVKAQTGNLRSSGFILSDLTRKKWIKSVRNFVLDGAEYANPHVGASNCLVVKEPGGGSLGAPLLMEALPESRMILLIRDPRDVMASILDSARKGGWYYEWQDEGNRKPVPLPDRDPDTFVKRRSSIYLLQIGNARQAYNAHRGHKVLVKYEDLRMNTLGTMKRIYSTLRLPFDEEELAGVVKKHAWENIPGEEKGEGRFFRKAKPGGWREDLTPKQVEIVEEITSPLLNEFYPTSATHREGF